MFFVFAMICVQGVFQVFGVASVFPFLALASDTGKARDSGFGSTVLGLLPEMSDKTLLIIAGLFAIVLLIVVNGFSLFGDVLRTRYTQALGHWLRERLLKNIISNPYSYFLRNNTGELLKKTNLDVNQMVNGVLLPLLDAVSKIVTVIFMVVMLLVIDPVIAMISAVALGGFYTLIMIGLKKARDSHSDQFKVANRGAMRESQLLLGGIKAIKVHGQEDHFLDRYSKYSKEQARLYKWLPIFMNTPRYIVEPLAFGILVLLVVIMVAKGDQGLVDLLPKLGVLAFAGYRLIPCLQHVYVNLSQIGLLAHHAEEVADEIERVGLNDVAQIGAAATPLVWESKIRVKNLSYSYSESEIVLFDQVDLDIEKNSFVAFVGETGSGKSTFVDLLLGLHESDSGTIQIDDKVFDSDVIDAWRMSVGYVPQEIFLIDDSVAANIALGVQADDVDYDKVREVARIAQIASFIETDLVKGYDTDVGQRGVRLSGGQRQRIGLARALYHSPTTLILDEATSALDDGTEANVMSAIQALHGKMTLIVIAHRLSTIAMADKVWEIKDGKIFEQSK